MFCVSLPPASDRVTVTFFNSANERSKDDSLGRNRWRNNLLFPKDLCISFPECVLAHNIGWHHSHCPHCNAVAKNKFISEDIDLISV